MNTNATTKDAYRLLHEGALTMAEIHRAGVRVDVNYCKKAIMRADRRISELETALMNDPLFVEWQRVYKGAKWNPWSGDQLSWFLFKHLKHKPVKETASGKAAAGADSLRKLDIPFANDYIERAKLIKARDTYLKAFLRLEVDGFIHPTFALNLTRTYRSSSQNPNWQNIPKGALIRRAIVPREGQQLMGADYGGIEVAVGACYHEDPEMIRYLTTEGTDMHRDTAEELYKLNAPYVTKQIRHAAKNQFVFPVFYGSYWEQCAPNLWQSAIDQGLTEHLKDVGLWPFKRFEAHVHAVEERFWGERFKVYAKWKRKQWDSYCKRGYVESFTGFRFQGVMSRKDVTNYPIQGTAFHCLLQSLIWLNEHRKEQGWKSQIIGQIHDEANWDVAPGELDRVLYWTNEISVKRLMDEWRWIIVPLKVEADVSAVDGNWSEMNAIEEEMPF